MPGPEGAKLIQQLGDIIDQLSQLGYSQDKLDQLTAAASDLQTENETAAYNPGQTDQGADQGAAPPPPGGDQGGLSPMDAGGPPDMAGAKSMALADFAKQGHFGRPGGGHDQRMATIERKKKGVAKAR